MAVEQYVPQFVATFCLELIVYGILLQREFSKKQILAVCMFLNVITHPLVCLVFPRWLGNYFWIPAELFAWVVEALLLLAFARWVAPYKMEWTNAFAISLAANALSAGVGLLIFSGYSLFFRALQ
jgi:hypothetical protein